MSLKKAFTFLELIVVLAIIGVILSVGIARLVDLRAKSNDVKKLSDLNAIVAGLSRYKQDVGFYPPTLEFGKPLKSPNGQTTYLENVPADTQAPVIGGICKNKPYQYIPLDNGNSFKLVYCLQTATDTATPGQNFALADKLINTCDCKAKHCGDSDGCGGICDVAAYNINADHCVAGVPNCGGGAVCSGTTDTCAAGLCKCGVGPACTGGSICAGGNCVPPECPVELCGDCQSTVCGATCNTTVTKNGIAGTAESYGTVQVNNQCWMTKNITNVGTMVNGGVYANDSLIERWCYNNDAINCDADGALYTWNEAMYLPAMYNTTALLGYTGSGVSAKRQGVCPKGWHIPSDRETALLEDYLDPLSIPPIGDGATCSPGSWGYYADFICDQYKNSYFGLYSWSTSAAAKFMCTGLNLGYGGTVLSGCAAEAGSAVAPKFPISGYWGVWGTGFTEKGGYTLLWTSSQSSGLSVWYRFLLASTPQLSRSSTGKDMAGSVRCLKD